METIYFKNSGDHTEEVLKIVKDFVEKEKIKSIVVASTSGRTGALVSSIFKGLNVVVVTHSTGFVKPNYQELNKDNAKKIIENGAKILTTTHALSGAERAIRKKFNTILPLEIIANALRLFGQGTKVAIEITITATDAGLINTGEDIVAIAGTNRGADTALLIKAANSFDLFNLKVRKIICKPYDF
jgi:hypothetical protein